MIKWVCSGLTYFVIILGIAFLFVRLFKKKWVKRLFDVTSKESNPTPENLFITVYNFSLDEMKTTTTG
jgi:hypothetical protein